LRKCGDRHGLSIVVDKVVARHRDLFQYAVAAVRIPIPSLALQDVAAYFGVAKLSGITNGLAAQVRYAEYYAAEAGSAREELRAELLEYNRDDLVALTAVVDGLSRLVGA
jgi:predicted RecB family nuclease